MERMREEKRREQKREKGKMALSFTFINEASVPPSYSLSSFTHEESPFLP